MRERLLSIYRRLLDAYGRQHWWPGQSPLEIIVGAILTQAVAWTNVERAIASLERAGLMDLKRLVDAPSEQIAHEIRPCLYYNEKAKKLKTFLCFLAEHYEGDLSSLLSLPVVSLRKELLSVRGIGEETADAIILYAAGKPSFVVDAYTRRILSRLGLIEERTAYGEIRTMFMTHLPSEAALYNEYHALLVRHAKEHCRSREPICDGCPLREKCRTLLSGRAET
jgi:endonuclease-3 related protein